ncbi:hypothetical protein XENORESO_010095 [Xenotaenia resolanae]|uniref:Uncharacterized protein n=1 Tax=Xenotaenia resolanae TaxID=208358 RepID=A0ABV0X4I3_9TELE
MPYTCLLLGLLCYITLQDRKYVAFSPDLSENTSDVVIMEDMKVLAGCGGVLIGLFHFITQYSTVPLLYNDLLAVCNHITGQLHGTQTWPLTSLLACHVEREVV